MTFYNFSSQNLAQVTAEDVLQAKGMWQTLKNAVSDTFSVWTSVFAKWRFHHWRIGTDGGFALKKQQMKPLFGLALGLSYPIWESRSKSSALEATWVCWHSCIYFGSPKKLTVQQWSLGDRKFKDMPAWIKLKTVSPKFSNNLHMYIIYYTLNGKNL